jgi:FAD/FMN-containing dehydrogenase
VQASSVEDVVEAVKLANELNCRVSIRSGGHSWAAWSVRDDAIMIDLENLKCMELNQENSIAKVSPSTTGRMLNGYLSTKGKMFAGGHCPDVGLGGFLLQGGMGWNCAVSVPFVCLSRPITG